MRKLLILFCSLTPALLPAAGSFVYENCSADVRLASAGWSARADDPSTVFTNPAGMTRIDRTTLQVGAGSVFNHFIYDPNQKTNIKGSKGHGNLWLPLGGSYLVYPYSDCIRFGVASVGYFGSDLRYNHKWVGRYYFQKGVMEGLSLIPAVAYKLNDCWSFGFGLNAMYGFMKQRSAINNKLDGLKDGYVNIKDYRWGFGYLLGVLYEPTCNTRIGLQYLSHVRLHFRVIPDFNKAGPTLKTLFTELGIIKGQVDLDVRVPQALMVSVYHRLNAEFAVMGDVGWQQWHHWQKAIFAPVNTNSVTITPKYHNGWHGALGMEWYYNPLWTFSAGIAYDSSVVKSRNRTFSFPVGKQWRFGTGARFNYSDTLAFDFCTELQWQGKMFADQNRGPLAGHVAGHYHDFYALFLTGDVIWRF